MLSFYPIVSMEKCTNDGVILYLWLRKESLIPLFFYVVIIQYKCYIITLSELDVDMLIFIDFYFGNCKSFCDKICYPDLGSQIITFTYAWIFCIRKSIV